MAMGLAIVPKWVEALKPGIPQRPGKVDPLVNDFLQPAYRVVMEGFIGQKMDLTYKNRMLGQNVDELVEPFRHRK